jgi:P4 family phage/plasmid primase-like protien
MGDVYAAAKRYLDAGLSIIPIATDGTKQPMHNLLPLVEGRRSWSPFKDRLPTDEELSGWFGNGDAGIAIVGGAVSGNLERIDFDESGSYDAWRERCVECEAGDLESTLVLVRTPRDPNCYHVYYRCEEAVETNQALAKRQIGNNGDGRPEIKTIIETRGSAGYTIAPGSPLSCHETGRPYECVRGDLAALPIITAEQREILLEIARSFNDVQAVPTKGASTAESTSDQPGTDYNARGDWRGLMATEGWSCVNVRGDEEHWRRPGKSKGLSATFNHGGNNCLNVFSSNAFPFEQAHYSPFGIFATLKCGGDYNAAARELGAQGFGKQRAKTPIPNAPEFEDDPLPEEPAAVFTPKKANEIRNFTDLGNAHRLIDYFGEDIHYVVDWNKWIVWDGIRWEVDRELHIRQLARKVIGKIYAEAGQADSDDRKRIVKWAQSSESERALKAMVNIAQSFVPMTADKLDIDPSLLCCLNGTLDLHSGQLLAPRRDNLITKQTPITYDSTATAPLWESFLARIQPDSDTRHYIQCAAGYSLTGDVSEQCLFFLNGEGKNGKSTFIETLSLLVGEYFTKTGSQSLMVQQNASSSAPYEVAALKGSRLVTVSEISDKDTLNDALVKDMTGGDTMTGRHPYGSPFNFKAGFKLWLYGNHKPKIRGKDEGIWRRVKLIPFSVIIPPDERDMHLVDKLRDELPGILNWAITGTMMWERNGLTEPDSLLVAVSEYRADQDSLAGFFTACCILGRERAFWTSKKDTWAAYQAYTTTSGEPGYDKRHAFFVEVTRIPGIKNANGTGNVAGFAGFKLVNSTPTTPGDLGLDNAGEDPWARQAANDTEVAQ